MSLQAKFTNFHDKIKLGREDEAYKAAREKDESILEDLKKAFKKAGYPIIDTFLQGSMSTHTAIKHTKEDFDIDRAVVIDVEKAPTDPIEVKKLVKEVLEKRGFKKAKIKKPCITADYQSLNLHIDIIVYRKNGDSYELAVGKENSDSNNRKWDASDPKGLTNHINDKENYHGSSDLKLKQYKRMVRYLKRWRDEKFSEKVGKKIYSIGLTLMLKDQFRPNFGSEGKANDLQALRDTVDGIIGGGYFRDQGNDEYKVSVYLPVQPYRDIFDGSSKDTATQLRKKLISMRDKLDEAIDESSLKKQCEIMRGLLGDDFEVPESDSNGNSSSARKAAYVSAGVVGTSQGA